MSEPIGSQQVVGVREFYLQRSRELAGTLRTFLTTANTGGIGIMLATAGSLAGDHVSPRWVGPSVATFSAGLVLVAVGYLIAEHRAIQRANGVQQDDLPFWKWGIVWNVLPILTIIGGAFLGLEGLSTIELSLVPCARP